MLESINIESILFLDIETVPMTSRYEEMSETFRNLWNKKADILIKNDRIPGEEKTPETLFQRAGIYAEFGRIVCISTAIFRNQSLWMKSFYGKDEKVLLKEFSSMLVKAGEKKILFLCAHNGKEFDYPFIIRRMLVNAIPVPAILDLSMKKPWEVNHLDTMELWKFGDYKNYTSLEVLAALFGIPTPKEDIAGNDVARVYYEEDDLPRIVTYCQKDVLTIVNLFRKFKGQEILNEDQVNYA